jgi:putative membrane protein
LLARRALRLEVDGLEHLPSSGPVLLAAHHAHHLYDGLALVASVDRPLHILVALDWVRSGLQRRLMEWVCGLAGWPVVLRPEALERQAGVSAYRQDEVERVLRRGTRQAVRLLRAGEALVVFPEGYPGVDPHYTPKHGPEDFVPFQAGFARLAALAQQGGVAVPIVPVGVVWQAEERRLTLRFGRAVSLHAYRDSGDVVRAVEVEVRLLSGSPSSEGAPAETAPVQAQTPEVANA